MRQRNTSSRRVREYEDATVIVKPPLWGILDGIIPADFYVEVHPADGGAVVKFLKLRAFYGWQAADKAINLYRNHIKK